MSSLGDMLPSDMLEHLYGLLPDPKVIYEVIFLDLLPPAAKDAALQHKSLAAMAAAADKIVLEGSPAAAASPVSVAAVASSMAAVALDDVGAVSRPRHPSSSRRRGDDGRQPRALKFLCSAHARWGRNAFRCADPSSCHMKDLIRPRQVDAPPPLRSSPGNDRAGRQ